jgi:threonine dehydratase
VTSCPDGIPADTVPAWEEGEGQFVTLTNIWQAEQALPTTISRTLMTQWRPGIWNKIESLQPTGSFKIRGATWKMMTIPQSARFGGVVSYSSGNHARAVARAARDLGIEALIVVPEDVSAFKIEGAVLDGADIERCRGGSEARRLRAEDLARRSRKPLIPPYGDAQVIAGQGTIGLELVQQVTNLSAVVVPIGGGGLISGIGTAVKSLNPAVRVIGVEPAAAADARDSFRQGQIVTWDEELVARTIADGVRTQGLSPITFAHIERYVDDIVTVEEPAILEAMRVHFQDSRLVVEPSGALPLAALLSGAVGSEAGTALVISGGNIALDALSRHFQGLNHYTAGA